MTPVDHNQHSEKTAPCCTPSRPATTTRVIPALAGRGAFGQQNRFAGMVELPGGKFLMGTDDAEGFPADGEGPVREVTVSPFWIASCAVTNSQFATFVKATGYKSEAEAFGWAFVFAGFVPPDLPRRGFSRDAPWWIAVEGADWRHPEGPRSSITSRQNHPVVHVSWNDASAYCNWRGVRLPTEAEWEYAARGGLVGKRFPWGDELCPGGQHRCNIWQGNFPTVNTGDDGYVGTAPVKAYRPNGYGLYNTSGNVWEWSSDWFSLDHHILGPRTDPTGPPNGKTKVTRGGSYLCHASYCNRYRVAARSHNSIESCAGNLGFRCAADAVQTHRIA